MVIEHAPEGDCHTPMSKWAIGVLLRANAHGGGHPDGRVRLTSYLAREVRSVLLGMGPLTVGSSGHRLGMSRAGDRAHDSGPWTKAPMPLDKAEPAVPSAGRSSAFWHGGMGWGGTFSRTCSSTWMTTCRTRRSWEWTRTPRGCTSGCCAGRGSRRHLG